MKAFDITVIFKTVFCNAREVFSKLEPDTPDKLINELPKHTESPLRLELFVRMLFSALVDADFLDKVILRRKKLNTGSEIMTFIIYGNLSLPIRERLADTPVIF